jgi:hypothetical protein
MPKLKTTPRLDRESQISPRSQCGPVALSRNRVFSSLPLALIPQSLIRVSTCLLSEGKTQK